MAPVDVVPNPTIHIELAAGVAPKQVLRMDLTLPAGHTVQQALHASGWLDTLPGLSLDALAQGRWAVGVWGRRERLSHVLKDGDRIELVRSLIVDPKEARRLRYRTDKALKPGRSVRPSRG